jgi:hypothetical protein
VDDSTCAGQHPVRVPDLPQSNDYWVKGGRKVSPSRATRLVPAEHDGRPRRYPNKMRAARLAYPTILELNSSVKMKPSP